MHGGTGPVRAGHDQPQRADEPDDLGSRLRTVPRAPGLAGWAWGSNPTAPISLTGTGATDIAGTIYAPKAHVDIGGNGSASGVLAIQIISWTWKINGNGNLYMPYDPALLYTILQRGLVHLARRAARVPASASRRASATASPDRGRGGCAVLGSDAPLRGATSE